MIIFDNKLVFHSNLEGGMHVDWLSRIMESDHIVKCFEPRVDLSVEDEEVIYQDILSKHNREPYDLAGVLYLTWRVFLKKFFNKPFPEKNPADSEMQSFCVEAVQALGKSFAARLGFSMWPTENLSMIDPSTLMRMFEENEQLRGCPTLSQL